MVYRKIKKFPENRVGVAIKLSVLTKVMTRFEVIAKRIRIAQIRGF